MIGKTVQADHYAKIKSEDGPFEEVIPKVWKAARSDTDLKDKRLYKTDFVAYESDEDGKEGTASLYLGIA